MEEPPNQNEQSAVSWRDPDDSLITETELWIPTLDVLPPEMHFLIAEQVVAFRDSSACMLTQVTFQSISSSIRFTNMRHLRAHAGESLLAFPDGRRLPLGEDL
mgnify:CR=1 FL=1